MLDTLAFIWLVYWSNIDMKQVDSAIICATWSGEQPTIQLLAKYLPDSMMLRYAKIKLYNPMYYPQKWKPMPSDINPDGSGIMDITDSLGNTLWRFRRPDSVGSPRSHDHD